MNTPPSLGCSTPWIPPLQRCVFHSEFQARFLDHYYYYNYNNYNYFCVVMSDRCLSWGWLLHTLCPVQRGRLNTHTLSPEPQTHKKLQDFNQHSPVCSQYQNMPQQKKMRRTDAVLPGCWMDLPSSSLESWDPRAGRSSGAALWKPSSSSSSLLFLLLEPSLLYCTSPVVSILPP